MSHPGAGFALWKAVLYTALPIALPFLIAGIYAKYSNRLDVETHVETLESFNKMQDLALGRTIEQARTSPRVEVSAPQSIILWPAFRSVRVAAEPLRLRIRNDQWYPDQPVSDQGFIAPFTVRLKFAWPPIEESPVIYMNQRSLSPEGGGPMKDNGEKEPPILTFQRASVGTRDLLLDADFRKASAYSTHPEVRRDEAVVIYCGRSPHCTMYFEYLARPVQLKFPRKHFNDWDAGYQAAKKLLGEIATPIRFKGER